jgi:hypothetical protein
VDELGTKEPPDGSTRDPKLSMWRQLALIRRAMSSLQAGKCPASA